ncbi:hypothetical protein OROGR_018108 [Orobanche gracilis]
MKKAMGGVVAWCMVVMVVVLVADVHETEAVTCNLYDLYLCLPVITISQPPSPECCSKLTEQVPCYCTYIKDPTIKPYLDSPIAKKVAETCGLTLPTC